MRADVHLVLAPSILTKERRVSQGVSVALFTCNPHEAEMLMLAMAMMKAGAPVVIKRDQNGDFVFHVGGSV